MAHYCIASEAGPAVSASSSFSFNFNFGANFGVLKGDFDMLRTHNSGHSEDTVHSLGREEMLDDGLFTALPPLPQERPPLFRSFGRSERDNCDEVAQVMTASV